MKTRNILVGLIILAATASSSSAFAFDLPYNHGGLKYTPTGVEIYSMKAKDFLAKWYQGEIDYIRNMKNGKETKYVLGQTGDVLGSDANDYFYGFDNFRTNNLVGGKWDDFYSAQHTFPIIENPWEGIDTYLAGGNTGMPKENIENIISAGPGARIYGNAGDNLIFADGRGSEVHGGDGNDVMLANGLSESFFGEGGIDTIIFPWSLKDYVIVGDAWGVTVTNSKTGGNYRVNHHDTEQFQFDDAFFGYEAGENTIKVGPNEAFKNVRDAIHVAWNGDTIEVESGVYEDDFSIIDRSITIRGVNGRAHFYAKSPSFMGKANFITMSANVTFENLEFSGNKVSDMNGAGIRMEGGIPWGIITLKNCYFHNNEVGVLAGNQPNGVLNIENTEFGNNGRTSWTVHTVNVGVIKELNVKNSYFHDSMNGHNIRSLANTLNVSDSFFYDGTANTSFNIEMAQAKNSSISGNTFVQTETGEGTHMILNTATVSSDISGNTFANNSSRWVSAIWSSSPLAINMNNNKLYNYKSFVNDGIVTTGSNNTTIDAVNITIPTSNTSVGNIQYNNPTDGGAVKSEAEFSQAATLANFAGKDIYVWAGKQYSTVKEAVEKASSGDKIYVDEWVYASDYATVSNKNLAIIGLGKGAELKKVASIPNGKALIVSYKSNLYVKNIIFSDAEVPDKNGAGIRYEWGTMTIVDSLFRNNENGILGGATDVGKGKIWIQKSQFLDNGKNGTGYTHAIYIGEIDFFDIRDSIVSGTSVGHHVKSRARKTVIENNLLDDAGKNASYNIDLPNGGEALVKGNKIIQSAASENRTMVSYSAEKNPPNPGKLVVENNAFESEGSSAIGVKNFRDNQVILRNNTFKNVSTKFAGNNITEENGIQPTATAPSTSIVPILRDQPVINAVPMDPVKGAIIQPTTNVPAPVSAQHGTVPAIETIQQTALPQEIVLAPANKDLLNYDAKIDALVQDSIIKYNLTVSNIAIVSGKIDAKMKALEQKSADRPMTRKENRAYFLLKMIKKSFDSHK